MAVPNDPDLTTLHVVVPVRGAADGKSRLGSALDAEERAALVLGMLTHTIAVLDQWPSAQMTWIVTNDSAAVRVARAGRRVGIVDDPPNGPPDDGLNRALRIARATARAAGASALLMLPADLPLLSAAALDTLLEAADAALAAGNGRPVVVIAPSDARSGTNALLLSPPEIIEPAFGEQSLDAHVRAAAAADASVQLVIDAALGFDLDTPDDLLRLEVDRLLELQRLGNAQLAAPLAS